MKQLCIVLALCLLLPAAMAADCELKTFDQSLWGTSASGNNSAAYRNANFAAAFPQGVRIGSEEGYSVLFTSPRAVQLFLPATGTPGVLNQSATNVTKTSAGILAGETLALALNIGFDSYDASFGAGTAELADAKLTQGYCSGMGAAQVLEASNRALGGLPGTLSPAQLQNCTQQINKNFLNGTDLGQMSCGGVSLPNATESNMTNQTVQLPEVNSTTDNTTLPAQNTTAINTTMPPEPAHSSTNTTNSTVVPDTASVAIRIAPWYPKGTHYVFFCDAQGFTPTNYSWYFGDGQKLLQIKNSNVYHIYTPGTYDLQCMAHAPGLSHAAAMQVRAGS
jgi:hypothetical protein